VVFAVYFLGKIHNNEELSEFTIQDLWKVVTHPQSQNRAASAHPCGDCSSVAANFVSPSLYPSTIPR
jgi:hypothetical protein